VFRKSRTTFLFLGSILLLMVIILGLIYYTRAFSQGADNYQIYIEQFEKELGNPNLSLEGRLSLEIKLKIARFEATRQAYRLTDRQTPLNLPRGTTSPLSSSPVATLADGIDNDPLVPRPLPRYEKSSMILNAWRKHTSDHYYLVYAGYITDNPSQGMVLVFQPDILSFNQYLTPSKSGAVQVVEEHGLYLVLKAENGDIYYFDAFGERFIESLNIPTITPTPDRMLIEFIPGSAYP
jgi:hypothetical protein